MPGGHVQGLPNEWIWIYDGEEQWTTLTGKKSTTRHAYNRLTGERLSVRDVRTEVRLGQGLTPVEPREPEQRREGAIYSRRRTTTARGSIVVYSFYSLEEAQLFVQQNGIAEGLNQFLVQARFGTSRIPGKNYNIYKNGKLQTSRYATFSGFVTIARGKRNDFWQSVYEKAEEFNYNKNSRFYVYASEH